jgi:formate-dependent phosphoribosylglycinamide formyltransferase (GAR transformylase)
MIIIPKNKKKFMILGGSYHQLPVIVQAKKLGYFVITVDYLPDNIGHQYSDFYFNVSTKDRIGVLAIAEQEKIDSILAFASEPAAITAAFVADHLGLPSSCLSSVITLSY